MNKLNQKAEVKEEFTENKQSEQIKKYNKWEPSEVGKLLYCLWELYENEPISEFIERLLSIKNEK